MVWGKIFYDDWNLFFLFSGKLLLEMARQRDRPRLSQANSRRFRWNTGQYWRCICLGWEWQDVLHKRCGKNLKKNYFENHTRCNSINQSINQSECCMFVIEIIFSLAQVINIGATNAARTPRWIARIPGRSACGTAYQRESRRRSSGRTERRTFSSAAVITASMTGISGQRRPIRETPISGGSAVRPSPLRRYGWRRMTAHELLKIPCWWWWGMGEMFPRRRLILTKIWADDITQIKKWWTISFSCLW